MTYIVKRKPEEAPKKVHLLVPVTMIGGPMDNQILKMRADEYRLPPSSHKVAGHNGVYRLRPGTKEMVWCN